MIGKIRKEKNIIQDGYRGGYFRSFENQDIFLNIPCCDISHKLYKNMNCYGSGTLIFLIDPMIQNTSG